MTKLQVRLGELLAAMEDTDPGSVWYLDRATGEVVRDRRSRPATAVGRASHLAERFAAIEPIRASRAWRIMADFVEGLPDSEAARTLARVLRERKPVPSFDAALGRFPRIREEWLHFKALTYRQMVEDWLELEEIEAELEES